MSDNIFKIVMALIPVIGAIITGFVIPFINQKMNEGKRKEIEYWVIKAVDAAEVLFNVPKAGEAKREYVVDLINNMFNKNKIVITEEQIRILLESAWREMNKNK